MLSEAFDSDPLSTNCFLTLYQGIPFLMSQQSTPLSPVSHSESSLTPVEGKKSRNSAPKAEWKQQAASSQLRQGISDSQGQGMECLNIAHNLSVLTISPT